MQTNKILLKSFLAIAFALATANTAFAGCRTETKFNEFTRTWSTNNVCDFGSAPVGSTWSFAPTPSYNYAPAYVAPVYVAPVESFWTLPTWVFEPVYSAPVVEVVDVVQPVATYQDSGVVVGQYWDSGSWVSDWNSATWVDRFTDYWGDFFVEW